MAKIKVGEIYPTNNYGQVEILECVSAEEVLIKFLDTGSTRYARAQAIKLGMVKDYMSRTFYGVAYTGIGPHTTGVKGVASKPYQTWKGMLERCYCPKSLERFPTYTGCSVVEEWLNFQVFAEWFQDNYIEGYHLDKDTLIKGNKVYGPNTAIFVPEVVNHTEAHAGHFKFLDPNGNEVSIQNLNKFCRDNPSLNAASMGRVHNGKRNHHKQWRKA